jgi:hypothetical protein
LLPLLLEEADLPPGYRIGPVAVETPAVSALMRTPPGEDPHTTFDRYQEDRYVELHQNFVPVAPGMPVFMNFTVLLMRDAEQAARFAGPGNRTPNAMVLTLAPDLGEARSGWRVPVGPPDQPPRERLIVRWQRGNLVFDIQRETPAGDLDVEQTLDFAARVDARASSRLPLDLEAPAVSLPATEAMRLDAALRLQSVTLPPEQVPAGYRPMSPSMPVGLFHPAQGVLNLAFLHPEVGADAALTRYAETWRRVYTAGAWFVTEAGEGGPRLAYTVALDADEAAAERDVRDPFGPVVGVAQPDRAPSPPLVSLGDEITFREFSFTAPDGSTAGESMALRWRHGSVVLSAESFGPAGVVGVEDLVTFARAVEAAFQASALAR